MTGAMRAGGTIFANTCKTPSGDIQNNNKKKATGILQEHGDRSQEILFPIASVNQFYILMQRLKVAWKTQVFQIGSGVVSLSHKWK